MQCLKVRLWLLRETTCVAQRVSDGGPKRGDIMQISRVLRYLALAILILAIPASSFAGVFVSVTVAPPVLPVYVQPACPGDGYIWTPGYWAYGPDGYYWVP